MHNSTKLLIIIIIASFAAMPILLADAQPTLSLDLNRDYGFGMGNDIAGLFSLKADVSGNAFYVEFYLDNQLQQNDTAAPYSWQFNTSNYTLGEHTLKGIEDFFSEGNKLENEAFSNRYTERAKELLKKYSNEK